ncbi:MAG: 4Fe-4S binding protein [Deltaproteobacteria bacterium]|nr:4Fe-4S binding protein [Deltaproteobacteria bacterium]MBW2053403.1 4Fe-4S binding protein [Deltaproteobacteria bacterium]MBW2323898.1 4Fe-4S binding protein [Deltaproteobacteria bacterium]
MTDTDIYRQLAQTLGLGESPLVPKMYKELVDEDEARVLLAAAPPATLEELAEKTGISKNEVENMIGSLFKKGLIFKSKKEDAARYYRVRQFLQFHDATAVALDVPQKLLDLLKEFMNTEWIEFQGGLKKVLPKPVMRVVPVNVTIDPQTRILAFDDVKQLIEDARNVAVTRCSCRVIDGSCGKPIDVCMQIDKAADYCIERETGRKLTREEAIEMLKMCEEEGLVHVSSNKRSLGHVICNCCDDCCMSWGAVKEGVEQFIAPSRFMAVVDSGQCTSCETCLERCFFDAISLEGENGSALVDSAKCMGCGLCLVTCPSEAIVLKETRSEDFVPA